MLGLLTWVLENPSLSLASPKCGEACSLPRGMVGSVSSILLLVARDPNSNELKQKENA